MHRTRVFRAVGGAEVDLGSLGLLRREGDGPLGQPVVVVQAAAGGEDLPAVAGGANGGLAPAREEGNA